tara:strand:- start:102 stop:284 length:183 start_codon:yes stop_codon:yes gene_type:complete
VKYKPRQVEEKSLGGVLFIRNFFVKHMELLFAITVVLGAFLLGSFLGKAFVALIQKFSGD